MTGVSLDRGDGDDVVRVLDGVSLSVPGGEMVAVVGPSGSGKSSLLAVAGVLLGADTGTVEIGGRVTSGMTRDQQARLRRREVGFIFQGSNLVPSLSAVDQLLAMVHIDGRKPAAERPRALELLELVGLGAKAHRRPFELSGGERQRVGIARALINRPSVLLADEPTSALDRARSAELSQLLARLTHEHCVATVVVTHDDAPVRVADRVVAMEDGRLAPSRAEAVPAR